MTYKIARTVEGVAIYVSDDLDTSPSIEIIPLGAAAMVMMILFPGLLIALNVGEAVAVVAGVILSMLVFFAGLAVLVYLRSRPRYSIYCIGQGIDEIEVFATGHQDVDSENVKHAIDIMSANIQKKLHSLDNILKPL